MINGFDDTTIREKEKQFWCFDDTPVIILLFIAIYVFVSFIMPTYLILPVNVLGTSMEPTLYENDKVILYKQGDFEYSDIIVIYAANVNGGEDIIKRVMGLPGDTVWFEKDSQNGTDIYIFNRLHTVNGMTVHTTILDEYYVKKDKFGETIYGDKYNLGEKYTLADDEYFVLGDNREVSQDSRYTSVGLIKRENIVGKALFIIRDGKVFLFNKITY